MTRAPLSEPVMQTLKHQTRGRGDKNIPKKLKPEKPTPTTKPSLCTQHRKSLEDRTRSFVLPNVLTLHQTFPGLTAVQTERLQMWEGPLIYFPLWFIFPLHITLVWQQCIIRLHVIYKIVAAVQKYSQQENFRSTFSYKYTDMHTHTDSVRILKSHREKRKGKAVLSTD